MNRAEMERAILDRLIEVAQQPDSEGETLGSIKVDAPKGGYPRQWLHRMLLDLATLPKVSPPVDAEAREKALVIEALRRGYTGGSLRFPADDLSAPIAGVFETVNASHPRSDATRASGDESLERAIGWVRGVAHMLPPGSEMRRTLANALTVFDMRVFGHHASLAPSPSLPPDETGVERAKREVAEAEAALRDAENEHRLACRSLDHSERIAAAGVVNRASDRLTDARDVLRFAESQERSGGAR